MNRAQVGLVAFGIVVVLLAASTAWYLVRVNDLQNQVGALQTDKTNLQTQASNLENQMGVLQSQISNLTLMLEKFTVETPLLQYRLLDLGLLNIGSGSAHNVSFPDFNSPVFTGGYGELSVYYAVEDVSPGNFTVTISLSTVVWFNGVPGQQGQFAGPATYERVNALNRTVVRDSQGFSVNYLQPVLIQTKAPYFTLGFSTFTDSPNWQNVGVWIRVFVYLRN